MSSRPAFVDRAADERDGVVDVAYPPQPWHLRGNMVVLTWTAPADGVIERLPQGLTPVLRKGRTLIGTAWVDYRSGGVLSYRELLVAVPVLHGGVPGVCITDIWVDSPASRSGGRRLWGIPKGLAEFPTFDGRSFAMTLDGTPVAQASWTPGRTLPGRWPTRYSTVQSLDGRLLRTPVRSVAAVQSGTARMSVDPHGPLGYLDGARPSKAFALNDFRLTFGR